MWLNSHTDDILNLNLIRESEKKLRDEKELNFVKPHV